MPTIMAGLYGFTDAQLPRISSIIQHFGFDPHIKIRSVNTSHFTETGAKYNLRPQILAEQGAVHKAVEYIDMENPESLIIGVMLVAVLGDGTILSNANAWNPPNMSGNPVTFWLGVCFSKNGKIYCDTKKSGPFDAISCQKKISQSIHEKMMAQPAIRTANPYTTYPECYIRDHEMLNCTFGEALFRFANELAILMSDGKGKVIEKSVDIATKHSVGTTVAHLKQKGADVPRKRSLVYYVVDHGKAEPEAA